MTAAVEGRATAGETFGTFPLLHACFDTPDQLHPSAREVIILDVDEEKGRVRRTHWPHLSPMVTLTVASFPSRM